MKEKLLSIMLIVAVVLLTLWNVGVHYGEFLHGLGTALVPNDTHANRTAQELATAVQHRDADAVKALFSKNAATQAGVLDRQIAELFAFIQGDVVACSDAGAHGVGSSARSEYGKRQSEINATVRLETTEDVYYISFRQTLTDSFDRNNVGVTAISVIRAGDWENSITYRIDRSQSPGITIEEENDSEN